MKILLTGSSGFVGRNILEHPQRAHYDIVSPSRRDLNLLDRENTHRYVEQQRPDMVIHAAGLVGGIAANIERPVQFLADNMYMGLNILTVAKKLGVPKLMNVSSSCMYPRNARNPLSEELILTGEFEPTNEGYALAKVAGARLCDYINREDGACSYKTVIPCNLYGRHDTFDAKRSHMIPAAIQKVAEAKHRGAGQVSIWGDGLARREFMYAGDFADFVFYAIEHFDRMPPNINVGLGHDYMVNEYYRVIADVVGFAGEFCHDVSKPVGMKQKLVDTSRLDKFGWRHHTPLVSGIQQTVRYYLDGKHD